MNLLPTPPSSNHVSHHRQWLHIAMHLSIDDLRFWKTIRPFLQAATRAQLITLAKQQLDLFPNYLLHTRVLKLKDYIKGVIDSRTQEALLNANLAPQAPLSTRTSQSAIASLENILSSLVEVTVQAVALLGRVQTTLAHLFQHLHLSENI